MKDILMDLFKNHLYDQFAHSLDDRQSARFAVYFDEIMEWNKKFNLISFKDEKDLIFRHFLDSLYCIKQIKELSDNKNLKIVDLGTGAGFPGIPVKIVLPQISLVLIESIAKKCIFLENINEKLKLNMKILNKRGEEIGQDSRYRESFDFILSRAVSKLPANLENSIPLLKIGGYFLVHKTRKSIEDEKDGIKGSQNALNHLGANLYKTCFYRIDNYENDYCIAVFKKIKATPRQFPRKVGVPEHRPL